jgi:hypothetical protein
MPKLSVWNFYRGNTYLQTRKVLVRVASEKMERGLSLMPLQGYDPLAYGELDEVGPIVDV